MKVLRSITTLLLCCAAFWAPAQVKISQMPALSTGLDSVEFPVIKSGVNYRASGGGFILNQTAKQQSGGLWTDLVRGNRFKSIYGAPDATTSGSYSKYSLIMEQLNDSTVSEDNLRSGYYSWRKFTDFKNLSYYMRFNAANHFREDWEYRANDVPMINNGEYNDGVVYAMSYHRFNQNTDPSPRNSMWSGFVRPKPVITGNPYAVQATGTTTSATALNDVGQAAFVSVNKIQNDLNKYGAMYGYFDYGVWRSGAASLKLYAGVFLQGSQATDLAYVERPYGVYQHSPYDKNYFGGDVRIGDSSWLNADVHKLYVSGSSKFAGNILGTGRTLLGAGAVDDGVTALQVKGKVVSDTARATTYIVERVNTALAYSGSPDYLDNGYTLDVNTGGFARMYVRNRGGHADSYAGILFNSDAGSSYIRQSSVARGSYMEIKTGIANGSIHLLANGTGTIKLQSVINLTASTAPTSSADASGADGDVRRDSAGNLYVKFGTEWRRFAGGVF